MTVVCCEVGQHIFQWMFGRLLPFVVLYTEGDGDLWERSDFFGMLRGVKGCDRGGVLICDGVLRRIRGSGRIRFVHEISGTCSGKRRGNCCDFFAGRERFESIRRSRWTVGGDFASIGKEVAGGMQRFVLQNFNKRNL